MQTWFRITVLAVCTAMGVAVALAVALNKPVRTTQKAATQGSVSAVPATSELPVQPSLGTARAAPVVAPYRDMVAQQVGQLEETLQQIQESSQRRDRSMLRAIS